MDARIIAAIITSALAFIVGIANFILSIWEKKKYYKNQVNLLNKQEERFNLSFEAQKDTLERTLNQNLDIKNKDLRAKYISDKRVEWISVTRETVAKFISSVMESVSYVDTELQNNIKIVSDINQLACKLRLLLNFTDKFDMEILKIINYIVASHSESSNSEMVQKMTIILSDIMQVYLKNEWERVKHEVESENFSKEDQVRYICKMLDTRREIITDSFEQDYLCGIISRIRTE